MHRILLHKQRTITVFRYAMRRFNYFGLQRTCFDIGTLLLPFLCPFGIFEFSKSVYSYLLFVSVGNFKTGYRR